MNATIMHRVRRERDLFFSPDIDIPQLWRMNRQQRPNGLRAGRIGGKYSINNYCPDMQAVQMGGQLFGWWANDVNCAEKTPLKLDTTHHRHRQSFL
jgi:hypothetical protein